MAKKKNSPFSPEDNPHDLVTFYSQLTKSVENACGKEKLAALLAKTRHNPHAREPDKNAVHAIARAFLRLKFLAKNDDPELVVSTIIVLTAEAVSRPESHVVLLLQLFACGDEDDGIPPICAPNPQCALCQLTRECELFNHPKVPAMSLQPPSARLLSGNSKMLSPNELLAIILFGERATGQEPLVATIMARYGRFRAIVTAEPHELHGIRDITKPQALRLAAFGAFFQAILNERLDTPQRITGARDIFDRYADILCHARVELVVVLLLDQQHNVIRDVWFGQNATSMAVLDLKDLLHAAIRERAANIALVHNHPGNALAPSLSDMEYTRRLRSACDILGIGLVDHIIVAPSGYFSFAEDGMLGG